MKFYNNIKDKELEHNAMRLINCDLDELKKKMMALRKEHFSNEIQLCSIVNAKSGLCSEDCKFCAQSAHYQTNVKPFPLLDSRVIYEEAMDAAKLGINNFGIVTSGSTLREKELGEICRAIEMVVKENVISICASLGKLTFEQFNRLKSTGLNRYHHNLETSKRFFPKVCTTHTWEERVETIQSAKEVGLEVCSGGLFGLGETWKDRVNLAVTLRELDVDCVPINFLNPISGTPFENNEKLTVENALKIIALYRYILPGKGIRVCGGRPTVLGKRHSEIYEAGANAVMTGDYLTSYGISPEEDIKFVKLYDC
jgi:biotin synthase